MHINLQFPTLAQLVEHRTVEFVEIRGSLVRFREVGNFLLFFFFDKFFFRLTLINFKKFLNFNKNAEKKYYHNPLKIIFLFFFLIMNSSLLKKNVKLNLNNVFLTKKIAIFNGIFLAY